MKITVNTPAKKKKNSIKVISENKNIEYTFTTNNDQIFATDTNDNYENNFDQNKSIKTNKKVNAKKQTSFKYKSKLVKGLSKQNHSSVYE